MTPNTVSNPRRHLAELAFVFVAMLVVLIFFADRNGYEGDDLNSIIPMLHLPEALSGRISLYKFDWQPLAYWTGYTAYKMTGTVAAIFLLPSISIAAAVAMLYDILIVRVGVQRLLFLPILMMFPEIIYSGLYFNSSALAYPFAVFALLLCFCGNGWAKSALMGLFLGLAVLMRLDFSLVVVTILLLRLFLTGAFRECFIAGIVVGSCILVALSIELFDLENVVDIYATSRAEIIARADHPGWDSRVKIFVATAIFSPIGWLVFLCGLVFLTFTGSRRLWLQSAVVLLSLVPFLLSMRNLLSVKYMMPVFVFLPVIAGMLWCAFAPRARETTRRIIVSAWASATAVLLVVSVEPDNARPYIVVTTADARQIGTHDGLRSWGAYIPQFFRVERNAPAFKALEMADKFVAFSRDPGDHNIWLVGDHSVFLPGGLGWRYIYVRLELLVGNGQLQADNTILFDVPTGQVTLAPSGFLTPIGACTVLLDVVSDPVEYIQEACTE